MIQNVVKVDLVLLVINNFNLNIYKLYKLWYIIYGTHFYPICLIFVRTNLISNIRHIFISGSSVNARRYWVSSYEIYTERLERVSLSLTCLTNLSAYWNIAILGKSRIKSKSQVYTAIFTELNLNKDEEVHRKSQINLMKTRWLLGETNI